MRWVVLIAASMALIGFCQTDSAAQKKKVLPGKNAEDDPQKQKKAAPTPIAAPKGHEGIVSFVSAIRGKTSMRWIELSNSGGFWSVGGLDGTATVATNGNPVRAYVPAITDASVTISDEFGTPLWTYSRPNGAAAFGVLSPPLSPPGNFAGPTTLKVLVRAGSGGVSDVTLVVASVGVDGKGTTKKADEADLAGEAADLLRQAKEAIDAKNPALAKVRLNRIVNQYEKTPAAAEARTLLRSLSK